LITKYERYQDYVIKDGRLVGEFEEMYRDFSDPWEQSTREAFASEKAMVLNAIRALNPSTVVEIGCGLGHFSERIRATGVPNVIGIDVSKTAVEKAAASFPHCRFELADILDFAILEKHRPQIIVMAEITWYVLDKLCRFLNYLKAEMPSVYLAHLLVTYPEGEQKYGMEFFVNLNQIISFFGMNYVEYGEVLKPLHGRTKRTYFLGRYLPLGAEAQTL